MKMITTTDDLADFCASLSNADFITIDTEFMRERTYYAKLCLIQIAGPRQAALIDPLADGIDLAPLFQLLANPSVLKVFHAARQDVEIFVNLTGQIPTPLFDTQVAAMLCGYGDSVSYETLVTTLTGETIDKSSRVTDWSYRPLTPKQLTYALADVTHLRLVHEKLMAQIAQSERIDWIKEEMSVLTDLSTYQIDPMDMWKKIKHRFDKPRRCAILRELVAWREIEAQRANKPRGHVIRDEQLLEIASHEPETPMELSRIRGLSQGFADGRYGQAVLQAVARAKALPPSELPTIEKRTNGKSNGTSAALDLLKLLLKQVSEESGVAPKLIASSEELEEIASQASPNNRAVQGWRKEIFGNAALSFKKGELAFVLKGRKVRTIKVQGGAT
jgi:ribonuclease D